MAMTEASTMLTLEVFDEQKDNAEPQEVDIGLGAGGPGV